MQFLYPYALLLLPLPLIVWYVASAEQPTVALKVPDRLAELLTSCAGQGLDGKFFNHVRMTLAIVGWLTLVLALAGPLTHNGKLQHTSGRDLLLAVDLSASMRAQDVWLDGVQVDRYSAVKRLAGEFIRGRGGDRVGLIVFADEAYLLAPLSYDVNAVSGFLDEVQVGLPGRKTAVGDAVGLAVKTLEQQPAESRVIIVLSDGDSNAGILSQLAASELARANQVRIHTIGFGQPGGASSATSVEPETKTSDRSSHSLQALAQSTGGMHYVAQSSSALRKVYSQLDLLEATELDTGGQLIEQDWVSEFLLLTLAVLAVLTMLDLGRIRF